MKDIRLAFVAIAVVLLTLTMTGIDGAAVMSIDLGSEWMKVNTDVCVAHVRLIKYFHCVP